jgi:NADH-quinone oxidoreductase subunit H
MRNQVQQRMGKGVQGAGGVRRNLREGRRMRVPMLLGVAMVTLVERKGMGAVQRRRGPNVVGVYGRRTPISDGRKLLLKETVVPRAADKRRYWMAPVRTFGRARRGWGVRPGNEGMRYVDVKRGVRVRRRCSGRGVYGIIMAGWASNSKYARRGGRRTAAQMMSYERTRGRVVAVRMGRSGTGNRRSRGQQQLLVKAGRGRAPRRRRYFVGTRAERNRHPFDLPEAEAELVSGYNVEYAAMTFTRFFRGEYGNMIRISGRTVLRFGGERSGRRGHGRRMRRRIRGYVRARAGYPRYRYDQLRRRGWKVHRPRTRGRRRREESRVRRVERL